MKKGAEKIINCDYYGNPIITSLEGIEYINEICSNYPNKAIHYKTKTVPSTEQLKELGFQFLRYDSNDHYIWYAKRNGSNLPWGPNHVIGARIIVQCEDSFLLVKEVHGRQRFWAPGGTVQIDGKERDNLDLQTFQGHPLPKETALQELFEETSLDYRGKDIEFIMHLYFQGVLKRNGQIANDIGFYYLLKLDEKTQNLSGDPEEISDICWFTKKEILETKTDQVTKVTQEVVKYLLGIDKTKTRKYPSHTLEFC